MTDGALGGAQRIEHGFFLGRRPDIGCEWLAIDGDVDAAGLFVDDDGNAVGGMGAGGDERRQKRSHNDEDERCTCNGNAHG